MCVGTVISYVYPKSPLCDVNVSQLFDGFSLRHNAQRSKNWWLSKTIFHVSSSLEKTKQSSVSEKFRWPYNQLTIILLVIEDDELQCENSNFLVPWKQLDSLMTGPDWSSSTTHGWSRNCEEQSRTNLTRNPMPSSTDEARKGIAFNIYCAFIVKSKALLIGAAIRQRLACRC